MRTSQTTEGSRRNGEAHARVEHGTAERHAIRTAHRSAALSHLPWTSTVGEDEWAMLEEPRLRVAAEGSPWARSRVCKAQVLFRAGDRLDALYSMRFGSCKTVLLSKNGQDQVVGFSIVGDVVGVDGIVTGFHTCQASALEDAEVFRLPLDDIERRAQQDACFAREFHSMLSHEAARAYVHMLVLGTMRADQRIAYFLLDLSRRYQARGYSSHEYVLRLSRQEIGSYLGLKLETVSRVFSRLHRDGTLRIDGRSITLLDRAELSRVADGG